MDFTDADMRTMHQQGDAIDFVRAQAGLRGASRKHPAEAVRCPRCQVRSGERCTTPRGHALTAGIHQARIDAVLETTAPARTVGSWPTSRK